MKKLTTIWLVALLSQSSLLAFEEGAYYYLSSRFQGEQKVLDIVKNGAITKAELTMKRDKKGMGSQLWKVIPTGDGYYRLTTKLHGDDYALAVVCDDPENDQIQLVKAGNTPSQRWKITETQDGYFRLTTEARGTAFSLDVCNEGEQSKMVGIIQTGDASGQSWLFSKSSRRKKS